MKCSKLGLCIALAAIVSLQGIAQPSMLDKINKFNIVNRHFVDTIPIEFDHNKIFIPVVIKGQTHRFIFDTGTDGCGIYNKRLASSYPVIGTTKVTDVNNTKGVLDVINITYFTVGKIQFLDCPAIVLNDQPYTDAGIEGCIGNNILKKKIIKIDVRNKMMIVTDDSRYFDNEQGGAVLPLKRLSGYCPYFTIYPTENLEETAYLDTGNSSFYNMSFRIYDYAKQRNMNVKVVDSGFGKTSMGVLGNERDTTSLRLALDSFKLGDLPIGGVETELYQDANSSMGADLLNYGTLRLDYIHKTITYTPYIYPVNVESDRSPFSIINEGGALKIGRVWENSSLYRLGLRSGFTIKKVNGIPAENIQLIMSILHHAKGPITFVCEDMKQHPMEFVINQ